MSRRLFLALFACLALALPASAEVLIVKDTNDGYLNMRRGPGSQYGIITRLTAGTELNVTAASGPWREVGLPDGTVGWAHGSYLVDNYYEQRPYDFAVKYTADGYLNMRAGPGTRHGIVRRLHVGQRLASRGRTGNWLQVELPEGTRGWVSFQYVTAVN